VVVRLAQLLRQAGRPDLGLLNPNQYAYVLTLVSAATVGAVLASRAPPIRWVGCCWPWGCGRGRARPQAAPAPGRDDRTSAGGAVRAALGRPGLGGGRGARHRQRGSRKGLEGGYVRKPPKSVH